MFTEQTSESEEKPIEIIKSGEDKIETEDDKREDGRELQLLLESAEIMKNQYGSDHCPTFIEFVTPIPKLADHPPAQLSSICYFQKKV